MPFTDIGSAVMKMLADTRDIVIEDTDRKELIEKSSTMPPHRGVAAALQRPRGAGFRLFTLTDNLPEVQTRQLGHARIVAFSSVALAQTASNITSRRERPMPRLKGPSELRPRSSVSSPAIPGTPLAPLLRAGRLP